MESSPNFGARARSRVTHASLGCRGNGVISTPAHDCACGLGATFETLSCEHSAVSKVSEGLAPARASLRAEHRLGGDAACGLRIERSRFDAKWARTHDAHRQRAG